MTTVHLPGDDPGASQVPAVPDTRWEPDPPPAVRGPDSTVRLFAVESLSAAAVNALTGLLKLAKDYPYAFTEVELAKIAEARAVLVAHSRPEDVVDRGQ